MATFRMEDGTIVKTENAKRTWEEATYFDGSNRISVATGSQWAHEELHCSRRGRYWLNHWSNYQGTRPYAEWVSEHEAARWLLINEKDLPEDLAHLRNEIEE